jgi:hypothetical protein
MGVRILRNILGKGWGKKIFGMIVKYLTNPNLPYIFFKREGKHDS